MTYLWEKPTWPSFFWTHGRFITSLVSARHNQGRLLALGQNFVHSYEMRDNRQAIFNDWFQPGLNEERLMGWQASLYPTGYAGVKRILTGSYRSKSSGNDHFPSSRIPTEIQNWLSWWNEPPEDLDPILRAAIGSIWFLFISPFEAGNYILAASLAEKALVEKEKLSFRTYDLALQFEENEDQVRKLVNEVIIGNGDLTDWIFYFLELVNVSLNSALSVSEQKNLAEKFWKALAPFDLNQRQRKVLNIMFEENRDITNREYVEICKTSRESAKRDLAEMLKLKILETGEAKGRSVYYRLNSGEYQF